MRKEGCSKGEAAVGARHQPGNVGGPPPRASQAPESDKNCDDGSVGDSHRTGTPQHAPSDRLKSMTLRVVLQTISRHNRVQALRLQKARPALLVLGSSMKSSSSAAAAATAAAPVTEAAAAAAAPWLRPRWQRWQQQQKQQRQH